MQVLNQKLFVFSLLKPCLPGSALLYDSRDHLNTTAGLTALHRREGRGKVEGRRCEEKEGSKMKKWIFDEERAR